MAGQRRRKPALNLHAKSGVEVFLCKKIHSHFIIDYYSYRSGLGRWNPFLKIVFALVVFIVVIGTEDVPIAGMTFLFMMVLVIRMGKVPLEAYAKELSNLLMLSLQKSGIYFDAMEARGYCGALNFWVEKKPVTISPIAMVGLYVVGVVFLIYQGSSRF